MIDNEVIDEIKKLIFEHNFVGAIIYEYIEKIGDKPVLGIMRNVIAENVQKGKDGIPAIGCAMAFRNRARNKYDEVKMLREQRAEYDLKEKQRQKDLEEYEKLHASGFKGSNKELAQMITIQHAKGECSDQEYESTMQFLGYPVANLVDKEADL